MEPTLAKSWFFSYTFLELYFVDIPLMKIRFNMIVFTLLKKFTFFESFDKTLHFTPLTIFPSL